MLIGHNKEHVYLAGGAGARGGPRAGMLRGDNKFSPPALLEAQRSQRVRFVVGDFRLDGVVNL